MVTKQQVRESLKEILVPGVMRSLVMLNLVREITVSDQKVNIILASTALNAPIRKDHGLNGGVRSQTRENI